MRTLTKHVRWLLCVTLAISMLVQAAHISPDGVCGPSSVMEDRSMDINFDNITVLHDTTQAQCNQACCDADADNVDSCSAVVFDNTNGDCFLVNCEIMECSMKTVDHMTVTLIGELEDEDLGTDDNSNATSATNAESTASNGTKQDTDGTTPKDKVAATGRTTSTAPTTKTKTEVKPEAKPSTLMSALSRSGAATTTARSPVSNTTSRNSSTTSSASKTTTATKPHGTTASQDQTATTSSSVTSSIPKQTASKAENQTIDAANNSSKTNETVTTAPGSNTNQTVAATGSNVNQTAAVSNNQTSQFTDEHTPDNNTVTNQTHTQANTTSTNVTLGDDQEANDQLPDATTVSPNHASGDVSSAKEEHHVTNATGSSRTTLATTSKITSQTTVTKAQTGSTTKSNSPTTFITPTRLTTTLVSDTGLASSEESSESSEEESSESSEEESSESSEEDTTETPETKITKTPSEDSGFTATVNQSSWYTTTAYTTLTAWSSSNTSEAPSPSSQAAVNGSAAHTTGEWSGSMKGPANISVGLVIALSVGIFLTFIVLVIVGKGLFEGWQRRHYSKMDYLINGIYN